MENIKTRRIFGICVDTNILLDFECINRRDLLYTTPLPFYSEKKVLLDDLKSTPDVLQKNLEAGLKLVHRTKEEVLLEIQYITQYRRCSPCDLTLLAIAKCRQYLLLTGDKDLRRAAREENVVYKGTLWITDQIYLQHIIDEEQYILMLEMFLGSKERRLPHSKIKKRICRLKELIEQKSGKKIRQ